MSKTSYLESIRSLLKITDKYNFEQINGLQDLKTIKFDSTKYNDICEEIRLKGINAIYEFSEEIGSEDLTFYKFSDQNGKIFVALVYDSDELWQDPEVLDILDLT